MPKGKTHKGTAKRMKLSATGKVKRGRAGKSHLMSGKSGKQRRKLRKARGLSGGDARRVQKSLGR